MQAWHTVPPPACKSIRPHAHKPPAWHANPSTAQLCSRLPRRRCSTFNCNISCTEAFGAQTQIRHPLATFCENGIRHLIKNRGSIIQECINSLPVFDLSGSFQISLAVLLGSDYSNGVLGFGPVSTKSQTTIHLCSFDSVMLIICYSNGVPWLHSPYLI